MISYFCTAIDFTMIKKDQDPMGQAIYNFHHYSDETSVKVNTNITEGEELPVPYLFRTYDQMPLLEKKAMNRVKGKVLDVGAGAGAHSVYLQSQGFDVTSMDISELSCEVMLDLGLKNVVCKDIWTFESDPFDTVLFMMNGIGLVKDLDGLGPFFEHIKRYVKHGGQVILDSSDIKYMFEDDEGGFWIDLNSNYYGELEYKLEYKNKKAEPFPWLFVDFKKLRDAAMKAGWKVELLYEDDHFHYLTRLSLDD
jgi:SAM-dependent methyltransferase